MTEDQKKGVLALAPYITLIIALLGFWYGFDNKYQRKSEAAVAEQKTIQTFDMLQQQMAVFMEESKKNNQISDLNRQLNYLTEYRYKLKDYLRQHPEDQDTKIELDAVEKELAEVKDQLDKLLMDE